ncbi:MAG: hypothetical protein PF450_01780 [Bacteroidales bacterium]|jgi:hypothetical protein|nr:hypothetical protein [Bacteroidales bacterium]
MKNLNLILITLLILIIPACSVEKQTTWNFEYPGDEFSEAAMLDLRYLNESYAGEHGFIKLSEDGESFVRGDGEEIRFWPVNGGDATRRMSDEELAWHARFLAKQGVNMNRWHGSLNAPGKGTSLFDLDTAEVEQIWRFVASMKKEGIYSTISPFWPHNGHMGGWVPEEWGIEGYSGKDELWEVLYFNDKLKEGYKTWVKYLYTEENPYTGMALKDDPAVALIQIMNEDGVFFWTMQGIKPELKRLVGELFADWLNEKYGSLAAAFTAWEEEKMPGDNVSKGLLDVYDIWELIQPCNGGKAKRMADQTAFYAFRQRSFYSDIRDFDQKELGCKQMVNPNNWKTADPGKLEALERFTYLDCEVPAVNRYFAPGHVGVNNGWRIDPGHFYQGESALKNPLKIPVNVKQTAGKPFIITESGWNFPQKHQSEAPMLISTYQSLSGHDAYYWFAITSQSYMENPYFDFTRDTAGMRAMNRWTYSTPGGIAQFPAYALLYRKGYVSQGETMIHEFISTESLFNRKNALISEETSFDPNRDQIEGFNTKSAVSAVNPYAFLTGPVKASYGGDQSETYVNEKLKGLIDLENGIVSSVTGELELDYEKGVFQFETPEAVGVSGFFEDETSIDFQDVSIETRNEYVTVGLVSMDGLPLAESKKILVQSGTSYLPTDWMEEAAEFESRGDTLQGFKILNTGKMPWVVQPTLVEIKVHNPNIKKAILLDLAGYPQRELEVKRRNGVLIVELAQESLYVVLSE